MSRPIGEVEINNKKLNTGLDTGSHRSYIKKQIGKDFPKPPVEPFEVMLGGKTLNFKEVRIVTGFVKNTSKRKYRFSEPLFEISDLGEENGEKIDILSGARILEDWGADIDKSISPPQVNFRILR